MQKAGSLCSLVVMKEIHIGKKKRFCLKINKPWKAKLTKDAMVQVILNKSSSKASLLKAII